MASESLSGLIGASVTENRTVENMERIPGHVDRLTEHVDLLAAEGKLERTHGAAVLSKAGVERKRTMIE